MYIGLTNCGLHGYSETLGRPSLNLDFAGTKALPSTVTHTRASSATYYNASGVLTTTPVNLLTYSQEFDNVNWARTNILAFGSGSIANATVSPSGETNADKAVEDTNNGNHAIFQSYTVASGGAYTFSVYLKTAERYRCLLVAGGGFAANQAGFNLNTGETYGVVGCTAAITSVGNGWYRCTWVATANASVATTFGIYLDNGTTPTYTGNGTSGLYIWGAQLETGSTATTYIPTTATSSGAPRFDHDPSTLVSKGLLIEEQRQNLLTRSQEFDNAAWTPGNTTVDDEATSAPDGTVTADKLQETGGGAALHYLLYTGTTVAASTTATLSVYVKTAERTCLRLGIVDATTGVDYCQANFDLSDQTTTVSNAGLGTGATATITSIGNSWYRIALSGKPSTSSNNTRCDIYLLQTKAGSPSYAGTVGSGLYIWGAQLEAGAFPTSYIPTTGGTATRSADVCQMTGTNFSSWFNATEGTFVCKFDLLTSNNDSSYYRIWSANAGTNANEICLLDNVGWNPDRLTPYVMAGSVTQFDLGGTAGQYLSPPVTTQSVHALAYKANDFASSFNGASAGTDSSGTIPTVTALEIGAITGTSPMTGHIARLTFYPTRLSNATLQALST